MVITPELFTDTKFATRPVAERWAYLQSLAADAMALQPHLDDPHGCGVLLRQRRRFSPVERAGIFERDGRRCVFCAATGPLVLDHIVPLARGGNDTLDNLQTLCAPCNSKKWAHV